MKEINEIAAPVRHRETSTVVIPRMRIVHCLFTLATGGAQVLSVELMNEMSRDHDVSLIIINNKVNPGLVAQLKPAIKVYYLHRKEGNPNPWPLVRLNLLLRKLKPDVIHCHEPKMAKAIWVKGPKLVQTIHDVGIDQKYYPQYDALVAISDAVFRDVHSSFPQTITIYNGIPVHLFKARKSFELIPGEPLRLVQLSRLMHEKKGQDILLQALHLYSAENPEIAFTLDFLGSGDSEAYLRNLARELGLGDRVNFLGEKSRDWLYENLCSYHTLIQPSRYEGFGLTILEGFAAGLPVIASNIDGPAEIINQTPAGYLFQDGDPGDCARSITDLVSAYLCDRLSASMESTLRVVNEKYSVQTCTQEYLEVYNRLIKV